MDAAPSPPSPTGDSMVERQQTSPQRERPAPQSAEEVVTHARWDLPQLMETLPLRQRRTFTATSTTIHTCAFPEKINHHHHLQHQHHHQHKYNHQQRHHHRRRLRPGNADNHQDHYGFGGCGGLLGIVIIILISVIIIIIIMFIIVIIIIIITVPEAVAVVVASSSSAASSSSSSSSSSCSLSSTSSPSPSFSLSTSSLSP